MLRLSMIRIPRRHSFSQEILRKAIHIAAGLFVVFAFSQDILTLPVFGVFILAFLIVVLLNVRYETELLTKILSLNRIDAKLPGLAVLAFFAGCWIVLALFKSQPSIAYAAIMVLTFGDPAAHLISTGFGGTKAAISRSSYYQGAVAGAVVGALAAWVYVDFWQALLASAIAMFVEAGELRIATHQIDDNFTIPVIAGIVLWVISLVV